MIPVLDVLRVRQGTNHDALHVLLPIHYMLVIHSMPSGEKLRKVIITDSTSVYLFFLRKRGTNHSRIGKKLTFSPETSSLFARIVMSSAVEEQPCRFSDRKRTFTSRSVRELK